jgi:membrane fusion protein, multidrug efflux system
MNSTPLTGPRSTFTRRRLGIGFLVALLLATGAGFAFWTGHGKKPDVEKPAPPLQFSAAEVVRPTLAPMPQRIDFSGPLVAPLTAIVRAKAAGTLLALETAEGRRVKQGQSLGRIDLSDLQSRVEDRSASVESAQAALVEAQRLHDSNVRLAEQSFISPIVLQSSQSKLDAARAQLRSAQAQLSGSRIGVREAALAAPISGIVGKRHVVPGEKVSAEQAIFTVVDLTTLELAGTVATHEVSLLQVGQAVEVRIEGFAQPVAGRIDRIAPAAEAGTRAIGVVVAVANADERLRAGQYAQASVRLDDPQPRLSVPLTAIGQASGQDFVWTIERGALVRRIVITGRQDPASGRVEVLQGLTPQSDVLGARFENLKEGALAQVSALPSTGAAVAGEPAASAQAASGKS